MQKFGRSLNFQADPYHRVSEESGGDDFDREASSGLMGNARQNGHRHEKGSLFSRKSSQPRWKPDHTCCYFFVTLASLLIGLMVGRTMRYEHEIDGFIGPYGSIHRTVKDVVWQQNETFAHAPDIASEQAWADLIPKGRGFVVHPVLTKNEQMSISVFHELHCLHALRTSYYTSDYLYRKLKHQHQHINGQTPRTSSSHTHSNATDVFVPSTYLEELIANHHHDSGPPADHVKHCFEYLRQALTCAADTNFEEVDVVDGEEGAEGFGTKRVCRDFEAVKAWSEKWRNGDRDGIV